MLAPYSRRAKFEKGQEETTAYHENSRVQHGSIYTHEMAGRTASSSFCFFFRFVSSCFSFFFVMIRDRFRFPRILWIVL